MTAKAAIAKGSKSFFLASLFFPRATRADCWILYRWCRECDDRIDHAPDAPTARAELECIRRDTRIGLERLEGEDVYRELGEVCRRHDVPHAYAYDLIRGLERDAAETRYTTLAEVEVYAYEVAGAVGLMMARIMGATDPRSVTPAKHLGQAMQLTNIARDVAEDHARGRLYLPSEWLAEAGVDEKRLLNDQDNKVFAVVERLLARAEELYRSGLAGLRYLPFRAAVAVAIAALVYRAIGRKLLRRGPRGLQRRTVVTLGEKLVLMIGGIARVIPSRAARLTMERI